MTALRKAFSLLDQRQRRKAIILVGLMIVGAMLETMSIGLIIPTLAFLLQDDVGTRYPRVLPILHSLGSPTQATLLVSSVISLVTIYAVKNIYIAFLAWRQICFTLDVQTSLAKRLFTTYLHQPYPFHLGQNSSKLMKNVSGEVGLFTLVVSSAISITTEGMILSTIALLLLAIEPVGTLIVLLVLGGTTFLFNYMTHSRVVRWGAARQHHATLVAKHLQQGFHGVKEIKILGRETSFIEQYEIHNKASAWINGRHALLLQLPRLWLEILAIAGMAMLVGAMLFQERDYTIIVSTLGLFAAAAFRLMPSAMRIIGAFQTIKFNLPAADTVYNELQLTIPVDDTNLEICRFERELQFHSVSYGYPDSTLKAVKQLSIVIHKGECIGIVGPSGSGKSTTMDLILGMLKPQNGKITIDGQDINSCLRSWQNQIGYVPQSIYLTDDTLRRNIAFGLPDHQIDNSGVERALAAAQLSEFVAILPDGLKTLVGERGVRLSGGQRQRIGIARALYHAPTVLVLDEATSALDGETESGVMEAIASLKGKNTIIIVAHRLSTVASCNRIYRLEDGKIAEIATPADLGLNSFKTDRMASQNLT